VAGLGWIAGQIEYLFYCARVDQAVGTGVRTSSAHDGVAIVASHELKNLSADITPPDIRAKIDVDELRVFDMLTPEFSFYCRETPVIAGTHGSAAVIDFLARNPEISHATFMERWKEHAATERACGVAFGGVMRCVHNELVQDPPSRFAFDGIGETWFATAEDAMRSLVDETMAPVRRDRDEFCDSGHSVRMLTRVCHSWEAASG
jgi:hypothetical protein